MSLVHYGEEGHECFCGKIYKTLLSLRCHQSGIHNNLKYSCEVSFYNEVHVGKKFEHLKHSRFAEKNSITTGRSTHIGGSST